MKRNCTLHLMLSFSFVFFAILSLRLKGSSTQKSAVDKVNEYTLASIIGSKDNAKKEITLSAETENDLKEKLKSKYQFEDPEKDILEIVKTGIKDFNIH